MEKERRKSSDGYIGKNRGLGLNAHYIVGKTKVVKKNGRLDENHFIFNAMGGGEFRSLPCHHLGLEPPKVFY